ncbi:hypothetical protein NDU88_005561 [Pleurodeles waltl]|uniref:Uncharacterized protein n=1 Tax=Pleurodeles waltl TaxID=8319 RepID=A0AAV7TBD0_PLEWA|nr:hypothetical protein NDU88_005561 [Pleurodeles waltl]
MQSPRASLLDPRAGRRGKEKCRVSSGRLRPAEVAIRSDRQSDLERENQQPSPPSSDMEGAPERGVPSRAQAPPGSEILSSGTRKTGTAGPRSSNRQPILERTCLQLLAPRKTATPRAAASQGPHAGRKPLGRQPLPCLGPSQAGRPTRTAAVNLGQPVPCRVRRPHRPQHPSPRGVHGCSKLNLAARVRINVTDRPQAQQSLTM